jgi:hypothetical protein
LKVYYLGDESLNGKEIGFKGALRDESSNKHLKGKEIKLESTLSES